MRPTKTVQSALRYPLTHILGAEANVRILRVLALSDVPIGVSELARQASLQASGVARICEFLEDFGVIESIGRGERNRQFRRQGRFALWQHLAGLFVAERARAEGIFLELRNLVSTNHPLPQSAWIEGDVASGRDDPGASVVVGVLTSADKAGTVREDLWRRLLPIQQKYDVVMELKVHTAADIKSMPEHERFSLEHVQVLLGPQPLDALDLAGEARPSRRQIRRHAELDKRSLELGRSVSELLRKDPSLIESAVRWLERRIQSAGPGERLELEEWLAILTSMSVSRLRRILAEDSPRMTRLRQSLPFVHVLEERDRRRLLHERET